MGDVQKYKGMYYQPMSSQGVYLGITEASLRTDPVTKNKKGLLILDIVGFVFP